MKHPFTEEQILVLAANPYTLFVNRDMIRFTVAFKRFLLREIDKPGVTIKKAFANAGYDPEILGDKRIDAIVRRVRNEANSPKGLRETGASRKKLEEEDLSRKHTKTAIRELQEEVIRLNQQMEFLKKILQLSSKENESQETSTEP